MPILDKVDVAHLDEQVWCDYPPVYLYGLKGLGAGWQSLFGALPEAGSLASRFLLKLPPVLADLLGAWVLFRLALPHLGRRRSLLVLSAYAFNPATTFNSAVWGQVDSLLGLLLLLAAWAVARERVELGFAVLTAACLFKIQAVVVVPALALAAVFLLGGLVIGLRFVDTSAGATMVQSPETGLESFRQWFWASRSLDLAIHVGLIFVGALGIAALLPGGKEEDGE